MPLSQEQVAWLATGSGSTAPSVRSGEPFPARRPRRGSDFHFGEKEPAPGECDLPSQPAIGRLRCRHLGVPLTLVSPAAASRAVNAAPDHVHTRLVDPRNHDVYCQDASRTGAFRSFGEHRAGGRTRWVGEEPFGHPQRGTAGLAPTPRCGHRHGADVDEAGSCGGAADGSACCLQTSSARRPEYLSTVLSPVASIVDRPSGEAVVPAACQRS